MLIWIESIDIPERIRKDYGDLSVLAESISTHGLINPITVMRSGERYVLIAGFRRLAAMKITGKNYIEATIISATDAEETLSLEIEENENRKDFTIAERVEYAMKLSAIASEKGRLRQSEAAKKKPLSTPVGRTRDQIAKKVGFNSGRQLDRALYIARNRPNLMEQVDSGNKSITGAYEEAKGLTRKTNPPTSTPELGYTFILNEVVYAVDSFIAAIEQAAKHYKAIQQNDNHGEFLLNTIDEAVQMARDKVNSVIGT